MTEGALLPHIILYTIPIILTSILQLLFNAADLIIVGRYCGSISVAAVGATGAVSNLIINLFIGLSVGAGVCVAHGLGAKKSKSVHRTVHTAVSAALAGGALLTVIGILLAEPLLVLMNTPKDVLPLSATYMKIYFAGMTFTMLYNFCASILRAAGDTKSPLIYLTLSGIINVILNVIFVTLFNMNVAGVALATAISQALSAILVTVALMRRNDECRLHPKELRFYKKELLKLIRIGVPAGIQGSLFSISNVIIQSSVNSFGPVVMSGNAASANIEGFVYVILNAFHQTTVNFVGQNTGAEKYKRVKKTVAICLVSVALTGIIAGLGVYLLREPLLSIYITDSAKALYYGMIRISYICIPYFLCGLMDVSTGALRGMGSSLAPMIISVLGVCGFRIAWILTIFQIERFHTPQCLYASYTFSWTLTFLIQIIAFVFVYRRYIRSNAN
ncbi:MAG: MATE family efflux transporter [Ruminococcaceae bacterium]|nr:MATE family efflux transporter [Oscillospiraceae bacterium]